MSAADRQAHWQNVYTTKGETAGSGLDGAIVDIGGGASRLVDALLEAGYCNLTVLDLSEAALAASQKRIGPRAASVFLRPQSAKSRRGDES
jgi:hypothetical protein